MTNYEFITILNRMKLRLAAFTNKEKKDLENKQTGIDELKNSVTGFIYLVNQLSAECDKIANRCNPEQLETLADFRQGLENYRQDAEKQLQMINKAVTKPENSASLNIQDVAFSLLLAQKPKIYS